MDSRFGVIGQELGRQDAERADCRESAVRFGTLDDKEAPVIHQK